MLCVDVLDRLRRGFLNCFILLFLMEFSQIVSHVGSNKLRQVVLIIILLDRLYFGHFLHDLLVGQGHIGNIPIAKVLRVIFRVRALLGAGIEHLLYAHGVLRKVKPFELKLLPPELNLFTFAQELVDAEEGLDLVVQELLLLVEVVVELLFCLFAEEYVVDACFALFSFLHLIDRLVLLLLQVVEFI